MIDRIGIGLDTAVSTMVGHEQNARHSPRPRDQLLAWSSAMGLATGKMLGRGRARQRATSTGTGTTGERLGRLGQWARRLATGGAMAWVTRPRLGALGRRTRAWLGTLGQRARARLGTLGRRADWPAGWPVSWAGRDDDRRWRRWRAGTAMARREGGGRLGSGGKGERELGLRR